MKEKPFRLFSRAALALLMMLLTTASAWADITLTPHITYGNGLSSSNITIQATTYYEVWGNIIDIENQTLTDGSQATFTKWKDEVTQIRIAVTNNSSQSIVVTYSGVNGITPSGTGCSFSASDNHSYEINITVSVGTPTTYTVHFDKNSTKAIGSMADQTFTVGEAKALTSCGFNYDWDIESPMLYFAGWATSSSGDVVYTNKQVVTDIAAAGQTITLYAKWTEKRDDPFVGPGVGPGDKPFVGGSYTVHFNANGGTGTMADQTFTVGDKKPLSPCTFTRTGYRFAGWNTKADGSGTAYADKAEIFGMNMTLYAQWTALPANTYYVHFDKNYDGAKGTMEDQMFTVGVAQALTTNAFTDELLVTVSFSGWNTKADGSGISYSNKQVVTDIAAEGQIITLYAQWEGLSTHISLESSCTVHFDANGGTGTMAPQVYEKMELKTLSPCTFTRDGYIFTGWNTKPDGTGTSYADQQNINPGGNITLYAQWQLDNDLAVNGDTYTINTVAGWDEFCDLLANNGKGYFTGKTVKLGHDLSVSSMAGSKDHEFTGTFNGQGNTLTVDYTASTDNAAPFRYVDGGTIENLIVEGTITTSAKFAAGFIADQYGAVTIRNCRSSVTINSSIEGDGTHGGFVGQTHNTDGHSISIEGCVFDGKLLGDKTTKCGGFIGWRGKTATIRNSLFAPAEVTVLNTESATFSRNKVDTYNCYYTNYLCDDTHYKPYLNDGNVSPALWNNGIEAYVYTPATESFVPANVGAAGTNYNVSGITAYASGLKYNGKFYMVKANVTLANNADNSAAIVNKQVADVTLSDRTLYKDGYWNTLVLPFDVTIASSPLAGDDVVAKVLNGESSKLVNGTLTLNFDNAPATIPAGTPFIIKWDKSDDLVNPVFTGVTIDKTTRDVSFTGGSFMGTYAPLEITDANRSKVLLLSGNNKLGYAKTDRTIANKKALGTCRAYFYFSDSQTARSFVMNFGEDDTTSLREKGIVKSEEFATAAEWYTLDGVKLSGKPTKKGLYIVNGKKVVIK